MKKTNKKKKLKRKKKLILSLKLKRYQQESKQSKKGVNQQALEEENLRDCVNCDYSKRCSDDAKRHHGHYSPQCTIGDEVHQLRICARTLSYAFKNAFPYLTS